MPIPESQLETWSHQGAIQQSAATHETIKNVLNDTKSPYYPKSYHIFLQGSYGNDTNVYRDSDVDIVIRLNDTYYWDDAALSEAAKDNFQKSFSKAKYSYTDFRADVLSWLRTQYGASVSEGKKAISIKGEGSRRDADVLVCTNFRRYLAESQGNDGQYVEGICFWPSGPGPRIENFPKQHSANCTTKHQATNLRFKKVVRIFKNMRNRMIEAQVLAEGVAPSYYLEGMLWNVPNSLFGPNYLQTCADAMNWLNKADKTQLACASDLHWLIRDGSQVCWNNADFDKYLATAIKYWNEW
jgi:hypothetical protein